MKYSVATVDISPRVPTYLGCGGGDLVPESPNSGLEANLIMLEADRSLVLIVSIDALYVGPKLRAFLENFLKDFLEPGDVFLAATHSHNAPMLDHTKPLLGLVTEAHFDHVARQIGDRARKLISEVRDEVSIRIREYAAKNIVGRRKILPLVIRRKGVYLFQSHFLPNGRESVGVLAQFVEIWASETIVGALWIYPCHPVGFPAENDVSADYVGEVRSLIREEIASGAKIPVVFLQGASGDLRPPAFRNNSGLLSNLVGKILGPRFGRFSEKDYREWVQCVWQELVTARLDPIFSTLSAEDKPALMVWRQAVNLEEIYFCKSNSPRKISVHLLRIAQLEIVAVSAEPTWDFFRQVNHRWREQKGVVTTLVGCIDDTYGYLASKSQIKTGGYEVVGFHEPFSLEPNPGSSPQNLIHGLVMSATSAVR